MLNPTQTERMLLKLRRMQETYAPLLFEPVLSLDFLLWETEEELFSPPEHADWRPLSPGETWGAPRSYGWFQASLRPDSSLSGKALYLRPHFGGAEGLLYVNGFPRGIFTLQNGNHSVSCLTACWDGSPFSLAVEMYTGHPVIGVNPLSNDPPPPDHYTYEGAELCLKDQLVCDFLFDLRVLCELADNLPPSEFRRAQVINCLTRVFDTVVQSPEDAPRDVWRDSLMEAREIMAPCLAAKNGPSAPSAGLIGHSHMDTAWLWPTKVTLKKCARTFSNQLNLMEQYPEHRFFQSSVLHLEWMRRYYPSLFEKLAEKIREGRWEPNGGVWVECDCNIPSGESIVRQFLWGQRYTQKNFNYRSNCFWLPDTFGYNAAIPQIMKGCGIDYFVTTKMSWNDTTRFPWETFYWEGIDGTRVFTHLTTIECWPGPEGLISRLNASGKNTTMDEKRVTDRRLIPYGFGDGGGGPMFEMLETARRCADLEGCPKARQVSAGDFLREMEQDACDPPVHRGELYLELHRGTLTNQHQIKRNNRKAEIALHNLELAEVLTAIRQGRSPSQEKISPLTETLLMNQFHDILPGTCLQEVHEESERQMAELLQKAGNQTRALLDAGEGAGVSLLNPLGFARRDTVYFPENTAPASPGLVFQKTETLDGNPQWAVDGIELPALGSVSFQSNASPAPAAGSAFRWDGRTLETPFARVIFDGNGRMESFFDLRLNRELRGRGKLPLNTFLLGEDLPAAWDNWDIDADLEKKLAPAGKLLSQRVISDGQVEFRLRQEYSLTENTSLTQDVVFHAGSPRVDFETLLDWHARHRFLKAAFDLDFRADFARNEIQFGFCQRPTTRNTEREQAMFEVCSHKYTDLSELDQGAAVLNDCKYGVTVKEGSVWLSLHKGGCRPDDRGDAGLHRFTYGFYPHASGFGADVIRQGYLLNFPVLQFAGGSPFPSLAAVDRENVILDTVKPCEDAENAFILRLYEAAGCHTRARLTVPCAAGLRLCNLLEEPEGEIQPGKELSLSLRPFQIVTVKVLLEIQEEKIKHQEAVK